MDEPESTDGPTTYPVPDATIAAHPAGLAAVVAAILAVLVCWRRPKPTDRS